MLTAVLTWLTENKELVEVSATLLKLAVDGVRAAARWHRRRSDGSSEGERADPRTDDDD